MREGRGDDDRGRLPPSDDGNDRPVRRAAERPATRDDDRPARRGDTSPQERTRNASADSLAAAVGQSSTRPTTVDQHGLRATLVGVPQIDLGEFVYEYQLDRAHEGMKRPVALFDLENTGDQPLRWRDARTAFVGTDDYTYRPAHLSLDPAQLGPGCHTRQVELQPGRRARLVTLVEELPQGVQVKEVVQTLRHRRGENERLVFSVD